ncbi:MAG: PHB depolymerase family esterase [Pseudomonadota bacterium]|uniref:extracellular catalytic domain type 1 short-chain-length polyhydroxyalkanoate depolymerase n=1 Tax=Gallaecimonas pentaromativorans TaxID=584787 RepID=UPI00067E851D|nr:PHB depolymerase family esterase [Gallaecimonas pentaromativorans]MED5525148.1 PHB depolymerase family esterase [Pseudomonadota bacterium]
MITKKHILLALALWLGLGLGAVAYAGSWSKNQSLGGFNKVDIYTPDSQSNIGDGRGLLLVLHGCTQSIDAYLSANLEDAAEEFGLVIAVPDAMNKAGFSCWSYWSGTKSRSSGDYKNLINLAQALVADTSRHIDANQVYIAGLSSGASFANTTACLAPDVFAGMGISAGPSIGTSSSGALGPCESADVASRCSQYAGSYQSSLGSQIASIAQGDSDSTVNLCYNSQNAEGMAALYGVSPLPGSTLISEGSGHSAEQSLWQDGRVSMLWFNNVDHAWSGGEGASGSYINGASINYARYLGRYFMENNKRVSRNLGPVLGNVALAVNGDRILVTGKAVDAEGSVAAVSARFVASNGSEQSASATAAADGSFSLQSPALANDLYQVLVLATDDAGLDGNLYQGSARVGPAPPASAPVLSNLNVAVSGQCALVTGTVVDVNEDLSAVTLAFAGATQNADISASQFSGQRCNLPGGSNSVTVTAIDAGGLSTSQVLDFEIDAGQSATLDGHISAGRLDYTNYANCYLEYGTASFTLREVTSGEQCRWQDDDASCLGPVQACSGSSAPLPDEGGGDCQTFTTNNYSQKVAGRAYSTGNPLAPDYFATGSDQPMAGSTWGINTLHSSDGQSWYLGSCEQ